MDVSPLAPTTQPDMPAIAGVEFATMACGIKYRERDDVTLVYFPDGAVVAGAFTKSSTASANVKAGQKALQQAPDNARALIVAAGNSNAFSGAAGARAVEEVTTACADLFGCTQESVYFSATGVIGEPFDAAIVSDALPKLKDKFGTGQWLDCAKAIHTTDTFPKMVTASCEIDGKVVTINGIVKGSGMIAPNMATMLGYVFTDAVIDSATLQSIFSAAIDKSFNCITVDSDTSTSDTVLVFATGKAGHAKLDAQSGEDLERFAAALETLLIELAQWVVKDGEGASKFITVKVQGAKDDASAKIIALSIANSPLVKTAIAGEDANWGRIVMAAGKSGEPIEQDKVSIAMCDELIVQNGDLDPSYEEAELTDRLKGSGIEIVFDAGTGSGSATVWTCDLTHGYITINADYRS